MTITSNIVLGVPIWQSSHAYSVLGAVVTNSNNAYQVITTGTSASSGGPTTTGSNITDGSVHWKYLGHVDYTSLTSWAGGIPGSPTEPYIGQVLMSAPVVMSQAAYTPYFTLSGHSTSSTNTITLKPFPGFGIYDLLAVLGSTTLLAINTGAVLFQGTASPVGPVNYFEIDDANVIFDGLQFQDLASGSGTTLINTTGANFIFRNNIVDGTPLYGDTWLLTVNGGIGQYNNVFLDHQPASGVGSPVQWFNQTGGQNDGSWAVGETYVKVNGTSVSSSAVDYANAINLIFRNELFIGYLDSVSGSGSTGAATLYNCLTDQSAFSNSWGFSAIDGGGNILNATRSALFVNDGTDFRLKAGSPAIGAGAVDTTHIPTSTDIAGHVRTSGAWDIGAWEYGINAATGSGGRPWTKEFTQEFGPTTAAPSIAVLACNATASLTAPQNALSCTRTVLALTASASMTERITATSANTIAKAVIASMSSFTNIGATRSVLVVSSNTTALLNLLASTTSTLVGLSCLAALQIPLPARALATLTTISGSGTIAPPPSFMSGQGVINFGCIANVARSTLVSASANINVLVASLASQFTNASGSATMTTVSGQAVAQQRNNTSAAPSFMVLSASGIVPIGMSAALTVEPLSCVAQLTQFDQASALSAIDLLHPPRGVTELLLADGSNLQLLADGSGIPLKSDAQPAPSMTQTTSASASGSSCMVMSAVGGAILNRTLTAPGSTFGTLSCTAQMGQVASAAAAVSIMPLSCVAQISRAATLFGLSAIQFSATGTIAGNSYASSTSTILTLTALGGISNWLSAADSFAVMSAAGQAGQSNTLTATNTIDYSVVANGGPTLILNGTATIPPLRASGVIQGVNGLQAAVPLPPLAVAAAAIMEDIASATASIGPVAASGALLQSNTAQGTGTTSLTIAATADQSNTASAIAVLPFSAAGTLINRSNPTSATVDLSPLTASGEVVLHAAAMSGGGTINFNTVANIASFTGAIALVELEVIVASHAHLWTSPIGFVEGDDVVWWPN